MCEVYIMAPVFPRRKENEARGSAACLRPHGQYEVELVWNMGL